MPEPKQEEAIKPSPHLPHPEPPMHPHILKILLELTEKVGKLEGMIEVLMKQKKD